jgi:hypothetical protein
MGGMSNKEYIQQTISISRNQIDQKQIEEIMILTYCKTTFNISIRRRCISFS